jgi:type III pantothenate kinase
VLLAVDIGNTQTVFGLYDDERLVMHSRIATTASDTSDELLIKLRGLFELHGVAPDAADDVAIASVVPPLTEQWRNAGKRLCGSNPLFGTGPLVLNHTVETGLVIPPHLSRELGADRIADAVAAIHLYGAPVVVVDFGTATNIEVVDKNGAFVGGIIAPGLMTSAEALFSAAARLSKIDIEIPEKVIGTSTAGAVQSGLTYGEIDRTDGLITRVFAELGYSAPVVATGGLSRHIVSLSRTVTHRNDDLTLEGLRLIHARQRCRT